MESVGKAIPQTAKSIGRPRSISEDDVRKLVKYFREGHTVATACRLSRIPRSTYYDELARNEELSDIMQCAQELLTSYATKLVKISICGGDLNTARWWLDRQDRREANAQRAREYRNANKLVVTETQQNTRSVSMEISSTS